MSALAALNRARQAWEATQPQYTIPGFWDDALEQVGVEAERETSAAAPACSSAPFPPTPLGRGWCSSPGTRPGALELSAEEVAQPCQASTISPEGRLTPSRRNCVSSASAGPPALRPTTSGPTAPPPKEDSGRAEGGHSK